MWFVSIVALLALIEYLVISLQTGRARGTYSVQAPATTGHPMFERWYRVQQNTVEQLVVFLPALFLFAELASPRLAGLLGLGVHRRPRRSTRAATSPTRQSRGTGFIISFIATALLVVGALLGVDLLAAPPGRGAGGCPSGAWVALRARGRSAALVWPALRCSRRGRQQQIGDVAVEVVDVAVLGQLLEAAVDHHVVAVGVDLEHVRARRRRCG